MRRKQRKRKRGHAVHDKGSGAAGQPQGPQREEKEAAKAPGRFRNWVVTEFQETKLETANWIGQRFFECPHVSYVIGQLEVCPSTAGDGGGDGQERVHWQGYVEFTEPKSLEQVRRIVGRAMGRSPQGHYEGRTGSQARAISYCSKLQSRIGNFFEFGKRKRQGKRTDLSDLAQCVVEGRSLSWIAWAYPSQFIRYRGGILNLIFERDRRLLNKSVNEWKAFYIVGDTGIGKTRGVLHKYGAQNVYIVRVSHDKVWWDGYRGEGVILWDDYDGQLSLGTFLGATDRYAQRIDVKYGFSVSNWKVCIVTSNKKLGELYPHGTAKQLNALERRFEVIDGSEELAQWLRRETPRPTFENN